MRYASAAFALGFLFVFGAPSVAQQPAPENDVYVVLYKRRVELAEGDVAREKAELEFTLARYGRIKRLVERNVASQEEYDEALARKKIVETNLAQSKIRVLEAEALLDVTRARVAAGLDMPICARN